MKAWFKKFFIPSRENSYAPQSLQKVAVGGMVVLILLSFTITNVQSIIWIASDWMVSTILPAVIVEKTNVERAGDALPSLRRSAVLDEAARLKAEHMAQYAYFAHYSPDGISPWYWFGQVNYNFVHAGENLAIHFTDSGEVVDAWMESPTHRANIMNGNYSEIGVGTAEGELDGFPTVFVVQLFGAPAAGQAAVAGEETSAIEPAPEAVPGAVVTETQPVPEQQPTPAEEVAVLADEASVTETVEIVPAPPEEVPIPPVEVEPVTIAETVMTDTGVALYSDFIATSTGGVPASIAPQEPGAQSTLPVLYSALTQPRLVLQFMYAIIGLFIFISLLLSILIEVRHQQPVQIAYGVVLMALMGGLLYAHIVLTSGAVIV